MPATKEQLHEAMRNVGITADNPQDFSIRGYSDDPEKHIALPYEMVCAADVDELNFLAARLEQLDPAEVGKLNAALQQKNFSHPHVIPRSFSAAPLSVSA